MKFLSWSALIAAQLFGAWKTGVLALLWEILVELPSAIGAGIKKFRNNYFSNKKYRQMLHFIIINIIVLTGICTQLSAINSRVLTVICLIWGFISFMFLLAACLKSTEDCDY